MSTATLNGTTVTKARVSIPAWGAWYADVELDAEAPVEGAAELVIADLTLFGTVLSGGPNRGSSRYRLVGGAGGWGKVLPRKGYTSDLGVKASTVLQDAASAAGESLDADTLPDPTVTLGGAWTRAAAPASRVLEQVAPQGWYVGEDGVTRIGARPAVELETPATRIETHPDRGMVLLAAESIATILPGAIIDELEVVDVEHVIGSDGLRSTIWGKGTGETSRRLVAWKRLIEQVLPDYRYRGVWEYRVVTQEGERLNLQPVRVSTGMPDLRRVHVRPGVAGCRADVALGSRVVVAFLDASPARPVVIGFEEAGGEGFAPDRLDLVGEDESGVVDATGRVVRYGDSVSIPVAGAVATGVVSIGAPAPVSRVRG